MKNSLFVSCLLTCILCMGCSPGKMSTVVPADMIQQSYTLQQYRMTLQYGKNEMSGILSLRYNNGWKGNVMNEFGVTLFNFTTANNKCSITNALSFLNKWYIRKTIEKDFAYLLLTMRRYDIPKRKMERTGKDEILLVNRQNHIRYTFKKIRNEVAE